MEKIHQIRLHLQIFNAEFTLNYKSYQIKHPITMQ